VNDSQSAASYMNWPCALTAASLAGGFLALILTAQGELRWAAGVVVACAVLDSLDGLLARLLAKSSAFGAELDSLADVVSFGVVPGSCCTWEFSTASRLRGWRRAWASSCVQPGASLAFR